jgi:hypothetical protein
LLCALVVYILLAIQLFPYSSLSHFCLLDELKEAIKAINTGKSEDIYGLSIENIIYAGEEFLHHLLDLITGTCGQDTKFPPYCCLNRVSTSGLSEGCAKL